MKIRERNIAMLAKWWWRCIRERDKFWNTTLQSKYGRILGYDPLNISVNKASSYTMLSLKKVVHMGWDQNRFKNEFCWKVADGKSIRFWKDIWYGRSALQKEFGRLFNLSGLKTASVRLVWEIWRSGGGLPPSVWIRQLREWEHGQVEILQQILASLQLRDECDVLY